MKATETTILKFIGGLDKAFIIPPFQRNYEWDETQCRELFEDILQSCKSGKPHYLGNLIYYEGENDGASFTEIVLVDGQQRVTTVLILLCAIRDIIKDDDSRRENINRRYLLNDTNGSTEAYRIRLKQTAYDSKSFVSMIDGEMPESSTSKVIQNYWFFRKLIEESEIDPIELYETIPKLEVVEVNLLIGVHLLAADKLDTVQKVFEKINSTGKPLTPADLIRNLLLLTHSATEQEKLYEKYWIEIENTLKSENISRFARDFLIMKIFDDVLERNIYKLFKDYFYEIKAKNEDMLSEMQKYSKFYAWLRFDNCPDSTIKRYIKMLNILKTDDVYPLYLYLLYNMYNVNIAELRQILKLITDFMLRYRIVTPSGGGGALRTVVQELLENIVGGIVNLTHDDIYFELSNSMTLQGRFPDDEEFKQNLMADVNTLYARVLLLKIEESETKNIPVEISEVTVEHLMPQVLSEWWKKHLGGGEEAEKTHREYLNSIGNLTPVSQSYNSSMSNRPWSEKISYLKDVQFMITSELAETYDDWGKEYIEKRNVLMANRAIKAVTGPLPRTRPVRTKKNTDDYSPGIYPLSDTVSPMNGSTPIAVLHGSSRIECSCWRDLLLLISTILINIDEQCFREIVSSNIIHKATSRKNYPEKDPIFTTNPNLLIEPRSIIEDTFYCEGCLSSSRARVYARQLLEVYGCVDDFSIEII